MPKNLCTHPACGKVIPKGSKCEEHGKPSAKVARHTDKRRGRATAHQRGYDHKWRKARLKFLKENPLCVHCLESNVIRPAEVVDHIIPHRGDKLLFWDRDNWQGLCKPCHNSKTGKGL